MPFTKIWRLKNVGDVPWPAGTKMSTDMSVPLGRNTPICLGRRLTLLSR